MEDDSLNLIIEIQSQLTTLRRGAMALTDPSTRDAYLHFADLIELAAREFDRSLLRSRQAASIFRTAY